MIEIFDKKEEYISLKEAAELSGYAPDYVGQLIRKGKLAGKQVYSNVSWMTTRSAVGAYMQSMEDGKREKSGVRRDGGILSVWRRFVARLSGELEAVTVYRTALYAVICVSVAFSLLLFFVFAVSFDSWLARRAAVGRTVPELPPVSEQAPL